LKHAIVFDEDWNKARSSGQSEQTLTGVGVTLDVVFDELAALPQQLLAQLARVLTRSAPEQLENRDRGSGIRDPIWDPGVGIRDLRFAIHEVSSD
jgi:hypothetical protein